MPIFSTKINLADDTFFYFLLFRCPLRQIPLSIAEAYAILNQKEPVIPPQPKPEEQNAPEPAKETETKTTLDPNKITGF